MFFNFEKCRPEVDDDVISGVAIGKVGMDACVKFGNSMLNSGLIIQLFSRPDGFTHFCVKLAASDVISGVTGR